MIQILDSKNGMELIADERREQIEKHGWTLEHDKDHTCGELIQAALFCIEQSKWPKIEIAGWPEFWGKEYEWKIRNKSEIEKLVVAGAFYLAETDRTGTIYDIELNMLATEIDRMLNAISSVEANGIEVRIELAVNGKGDFKPDELIYSAFTKCQCGKGLAYPKKIGVWGAWYCSDILLGLAVTGKESKIHDRNFPFSMYEIKSEYQPSANGATTRPV